MSPDVKPADRQRKGGGPKPTSHQDWLFGYAPRRRLLTSLFGPQSERAEIPEAGLSAAQLAKLAGYYRTTVPPDIEALEALGLLRRVRVGKRDRFLPRDDCPLARSLCLLLESIERLELSEP